MYVLQNLWNVSLKRISNEGSLNGFIRLHIGGQPGLVTRPSLYFWLGKCVLFILHMDVVVFPVVFITFNK